MIIMTEVILTDIEGNTLRSGIDVGGIVTPDCFMDPARNQRIFDELQNFKYRDDDIMLCTFPKSGTNWVYEILSMINNRSADRVLSYKNMSMIEFKTQQDIDEIPSPRVLNSHFRPSLLPKDRCKTKTILCLRNPKDVAASFYHHIVGISHYGYTGSFACWLPLYLEGNHSKSDVGPVQLDLFTCPPSQVACLRQYYETLRPISQYHGLSPLQFQTTLQGDSYTDLSRSKLFLKCRLLKADGGSFSNQDEVTPVNLFLHAMFSEVDVKMNEVLVASTGNMYPYVAYFHTLLRNSQEKKQSALTEQLYFADSPGLMDATSIADGNYGLFARHTLTKGSKTFEVAGPILSDCLMLDRYLLNGVKLDICLKRSSPKFCLMSSEDLPLASDNYRVVIEDAFLRLYKLKINPAVLVAHSKLLRSGVTAKYPYTKREVKYCTVPPNLTIFSWSHICQNPTPSLVAVAFCHSEAVAGSYKKNPWNLINSDVKQLTLCVNGISTPGDPIQVDFSTENNGGQVLQAFDGYHDTLNNINVGITRADVGRGYAMYLFHLEPSFSENAQFPLVKSGEISLNVRFGTPLPEGATCVIYTEKVGLLEFDETRNIKIN